MGHIKASVKSMSSQKSVTSMSISKSGSKIEEEAAITKDIVES